jgi:predicted alpha/beta hydrolase family esterase
MNSKRVFLIHGWAGSPKGGWFDWLKIELEKKGFTVIAPQMPNAETPKIGEWVPFLSEVIKEPQEGDFFVGHSIGCQTIIRYLESISPKKVGGAVFVAGWFNLKGLEGPDEEKLASPWVVLPIDFEKVKATTNKFLALLSDNDPYVPLGDETIFEKKMGAKVIIEHNRGHFSGEDGSFEIPEVLKFILTG